MRRGDVRRIEGAEGHSWSQLHPFPVWGAAGRGQAWGHAGPVLRLGPGAGSELPPACVCVYKTACVFLCELREEGRRHICFWSPQKALLSGPGGAGVPVEHGAGAGGASERSHSMCRVQRGAMWPVLPPTLPSLSYPAASFYIFRMPARPEISLHVTELISI